MTSSAGTILLVNSNRMRPPIAPLALDYVGGHLRRSGFEVRVVDLAFEGDARQALADAVTEGEPMAVGVTFRNTDDCFWPSCAWFVPRLKALVDDIRRCTTVPIVLGGCGYSVFPKQVVETSGADLGIAGDGEAAFAALAHRLAGRQAYDDLPGLVHRPDGGSVVLNPPEYTRSLDVPTDRDLLDNARYLREGGQGNIETKRGCPSPCIYCADPVAKGKRTRLRDPRQVADEVASLVAQGVTVLHLCDAEFNMPADHAMAVCQELIGRDLGERVRWYVYAAAHPFSAELALAMRRAGCVGVNFGVDSGSDRMLGVLHRGYDSDAIRSAVEACRQAGLLVMLDLLLAAPSENVASLRETIELIQRLNPDRVGAATGVRLYPGTPMAEMIRRQGPLGDNPNLHGQTEDNDDFLRPVFYIEHELGEDPVGLVRDLIGDDERFFKPAPVEADGDYNYNDNTELEQAIAAGHRGAYWDILRRLSEGEPPLA